MPNKLLCVFSILLVSVCCNSAQCDIVIDGYTDALHDRFTNSVSFILNHQDLSGIGQTDGGTSGTAGNWATAISRNVVITAHHYRPSANETIYFYPSNDPSATPVQRHIVSGQRLSGTDIYIGLLNDPLPNTIKHYDFATEPLSGTPPNGQNIFIENAGIYQGLNAYVFGKSPFNHNSDPNDDRTSFNDQAIGRNVITGYSENVPFNGNTDNDSIIMFHDSNGDSEFVQYEARLRSGDSGGPLFVEINGTLRLIGTNAFLLNGDVGSGVNYTGNQASAINNFINANAVPEPGSGFLIFSIALASFVRRRRISLRS